MDAFGSKGRLLLDGGIMPANETKVFLARLGETVLTELTVPDRFRHSAEVAMSAVPGAPDMGEGPRFAMALAYADMVRAIRNGGQPRRDSHRLFIPTPSSRPRTAARSNGSGLPSGTCSSATESSRRRDVNRPR